ncbi:bifunctional metallophosphatase/5'-nucleotidase [Azotosporobacter soli]|uniref:bifunctional metallophosphatase/5'-nucleotidase n=1 Tax=Azotosporobacter soli TaxID=3055040 RepID=UPI0031FEB54D
MKKSRFSLTAAVSRRQFLRSCATAAGVLFFAPHLTSSFAQAADDKIKLLVTSDLHGNLVGWDYFTAKAAELGLAKISTLVKEERLANPNCLLIDNGDILQGTPLDTYYSSVDKSWQVHPMFQAFNAMHYDAVVLGNHEFNYGRAFLEKVIAGSACPLLSANTLDAKTGRCWSRLKPYIIKQFTVAGRPLRVGLIGLTTSAVPNWENPANFSGLAFEDQIAAARRYVAEIKDKTDLIILSSHSGVEISGEESFSNENQIAALAAACPEVSLIIAGHKHQTLDNDNPVRDANRNVVYDRSLIKNKPVLEPNCWGKFLGTAEFGVVWQDGRWQISSIQTANRPTKDVVEDEEILQLAKPYHDATVAYLNTTIAKASGDFDAVNGTLQDTALVSLINRIQRQVGHAQLSAAATFNPEARITRGDIRLQNIYALYIYENYLYTIQISGAQLRRYLEHAATFYKQVQPGDSAISTNNHGMRDYNYDMIQGVDYTFDLSLPEGERLQALTFNGAPVSDSDTFTLALNNYRYNGGGGYMAALGFDATHRPTVLFDSQKNFGDQGQLRNLIINYIKEQQTLAPVIYDNWHLTTGQ